MDELLGHRNIGDRYYYNGRAVVIVKNLRIIDTVIIKFLDNTSEIRSIKFCCLEDNDAYYKSLKFIRVSELAKLY